MKRRRRHSRRRRTAAISVAVAIVLLALALQHEDNSGAASPPAPAISGVVAGIRKILVGYTPPTDAKTAGIRNYRATCVSSDGGLSGTSGWRTVAPITVRKVTTGKRYTCTVVARNAQGIGSASAPSAAVTIPAAPGAPSPAAVVGLGDSMLVFVRPPASNGGAVIKKYQASCRSRQTGARTDSPWVAGASLRVNRLAPDQAYACTARARNAVGIGRYSGAANGTTAPSGASIPAFAPAGWRQVFADSFETLDTRKWGRYQGTPGSDPGGWWTPSHVITQNGYAQLGSFVDGGRWASGGFSSANALKQRYGKYLVRFRMDAGYGVGYAMLLWPSSGTWPTAGEIDFGEDGGGNRQVTTATLHYGANDSTLQKNISADFTKWHTLGVEWTANKLVYTLDGANWATVNSTNVPKGPMELDVQTQTGTCGDHFRPCPNGTTPARVNMQIDWIVAYAPL